MVAIFSLLLSLVSIASALVVPRDGAKVLSDLHQVNADFVALARADKEYPSTKNASAIQARVDQAIADNEQVIAGAAASLTISNGWAIIRYISDTLEPSIRAAIDATVANKAQIAKAGASSIIVTDTTELKADNLIIGTAIGAKIPKSQQDALKSAISKIDRDYNYGISQFL